MSSAPAFAGERGSSGSTRVRHPVGLWCVFALVHLGLIALCLWAPGWPLGDVDRVYLGWARAAAAGTDVVGITSPFVYPILALAPILFAGFLGPTAYSLVWLGMVTLLNAGAFAFLVHRRPDSARAATRAEAAAWWWLGFLAFLGPIALARIDAVTVPIVIVALLWLRTRPLWATVLLTIAAWIKVWPAALIGALVVASRDRARHAVAAVATSALIVGVALLLGSGSNVLSFVTQQTSRGIQIEAPVALLWMWQVALGVPGSLVYYDHEILTYQLIGPGIGVAGALLTPLLVAVVVAVVLVAVRARRRGADFTQLFPPVVLALVATLIFVNKVGSPQFIAWLAAPVVLGLVMSGRSWRVPAALVAALALLTQLIYPYLYGLLLEAAPPMVLVLTIRNALELVVLGWSVKQLWSLPRTVRGTGRIHLATAHRR